MKLGLPMQGTNMRLKVFRTEVPGKMLRPEWKEGLDCALQNYDALPLL
jgi:hypothetical protein